MLTTTTSSPSPRSFATPSSPRFYVSRSSPRAQPAQSPKTLPRSSPAQPATQAAAIPSPAHKHTADAGTQYTPPDYPPTSSLSSLHATHDPQPWPQPPADPQPMEQPRSDGWTSTSTAVDDAPVPPPPPPPEPQLRITPQSTLQPSSSSSGQRRPCSPSESSTGFSTNPSSPKRARPQPGAAKVMPADYTTCNPSDLVALIADMLMELIRYNDAIPLKDGHLTRFHSRAPPGISVQDYLQRMTEHATLPPPILLAMVNYIDKLCVLYPTFTLNSLTAHRFLITAATVASKGLSDSFWTNSLYARVGGVSIKELALLELELLSRMQWRIVPTPESLREYYSNLVARSAAHVMEGDADGEPEAALPVKLSTESTEASTEMSTDVGTEDSLGTGQDGEADVDVMDVVDGAPTAVDAGG